MTIEEILKEIETTLNDLRPMFVDKAELTFIMRLPGNDNADMVVTDDDLSELRELIERSMMREGI